MVIILLSVRVGVSTEETPKRVNPVLDGSQWLHALGNVV